VVIPSSETISKVDFSQRPFKLWLEGKEDKQPYLAETVIVATGATAKRLNLPGEEQYWQHGISACAVCDGERPFFVLSDPRHPFMSSFHVSLGNLCFCDVNVCCWA